MQYGPEEQRNFCQANHAAIRKEGYVAGLRKAIEIVKSNSKSKAATTRQLEAEIKKSPRLSRFTIS